MNAKEAAKHEALMGGPMYWHPTKEVLDGKRSYAFTRMDSLEYMRALPDKCVDLIFGSPPYENSRFYGELDFRLKGQAWVDWLVPFFAEGKRVCKGLMALVVGHGRTEDWKWSGAPTLLEADLIRAGCRLRNPPVFGRVGICGSGQSDWLRADHERIVCMMCNDDGPLPWSNNVAHGHPPKWGPGGEMTAYLANGSRRNQWGSSEQGGCKTRRQDGVPHGNPRPSHRVKRARKGRYANGDIKEQGYCAPVLANPGNLLYGKVGGGHMGHKLAGQNEASFPLWLADFFVLSFCQPAGIVYDPFSGSGTTIHSAVENRRRGLGTDLRGSQIAIAARRLEGITPRLFVESDEVMKQREEGKQRE
jgi:hypothetical protein